MKTKKINKYIFGFICSLIFSFFMNTNIYAALDMTEWEIDIEKDIVDDYKIKADEANVAFMKDKDSVVGDIVEHIYLESSSTSGFDSSPLDDDEFDIYKENLYNYWGELLYSYTKATGYVNGTAEILGSSTAQEGFGYNFFLDDTGVHNIFANHLDWTEAQKEEYKDIIEPLARTLKSASQNCGFSLYPTCVTYNNTWTFGCSLYVNGTLIDSIQSYTIEADADYWSSSGMDYYKGLVNDLVNRNKTTIIQNAYLNADFGSSCAFNTYVLNNVDLFFNNYNFSGWTWDIENQKKLSIRNDTSTKIEDIANPSIGSWVYAVFYDISYINTSVNMAQQMYIADSSDKYVQARKDCLSYIIKTYNRVYAENFMTMINNTSSSMTLHLKNKRYRTNTEYVAAATAVGQNTQRVVYYEGATFKLDDAGNDNEFIRTYGSSGFYFKNRCLNLNYYGISDNELSNDMKLDTNNDDHIYAIYELFLSVNNPQGIQDNKEYYQRLVRTANHLEGKELWVQPCPFNILFDDTRVNYTEFLTTSCIINNPLDRYEFWGQNVSNENDTTYYGEAIELLPDNPNDTSTKNKDGYIGAPNHIVELNPNDNWGIYLFTRYKYVNYVYKIYYGFYGANPRMIAIETNRSVQHSKFYEDLPSITFSKLDDNMYGWFWKTTYSIREISGGNYVTEDMVTQQETLIKERIMQNVEANNNIKWLNSNEINYPNQLNNYGVFDPHNNRQYGKGDLYCYENPVRAETIYYQVNVPFSVDSDGNRNASDYILSLGADKNETFQCEKTVTLCECDDEVGGCSTDTDELIISATVTN